MEEYEAIMLYILRNCNEVELYIINFEDEMITDNIEMNDEESSWRVFNYCRGI